MGAPLSLPESPVQIEDLSGNLDDFAEAVGTTMLEVFPPRAAKSMTAENRAVSPRPFQTVGLESSDSPWFGPDPLRPDSFWIGAVLRGDQTAFEPLIKKYQSRVFATARRYARRQSEVDDIVQEVFIKAHQKLGGFRGEGPFEHWLMRLAVRTCFNFLRSHQRNRETSFTELSPLETNWLETHAAEPGDASEHADAARLLIHRILELLTPSARLVITLLEIEERSTREIAELTGWSVPMVKVKAFRARAEMRKRLAKLPGAKYL